MRSHDLGMCFTRPDWMPTRLGEVALGATMDGETELGTETSTSISYLICAFGEGYRDKGDFR